MLNVLIGAEAVGLAIVGAIVLVRGEGPPTGDFAFFAVLSGVAGIIGLAAFYRGLAIGNMGVVAPISATAAVIPLAIGIATGDRPSGARVGRRSAWRWPASCWPPARSWERARARAGWRAEPGWRCCRRSASGSSSSPWTVPATETCCGRFSSIA